MSKETWKDIDGFPDPKSKPQINHIDGNKYNNIVSNLEWCDSSENQIHAIKNGLTNIKPGTKARVTKPVKILETGECFESLLDCAARIGVRKSTIWHYLNDDVEHNRNGLKGYSICYITNEEYHRYRSNKSSFLYNYQFDAVRKMRNGCILNGGVGSGKSRTGLYYYFKEQGGSIDPDYIPMKNPKDLYILTTAMKRDLCEFEGELAPFLISTDPKINYYDNKVVIDSWNNIQKYSDIQGAFFIFDEDRVTGSGAWVKAFLKIAKKNNWIILSASPGDDWMQYVPVFIANGFYKNKTEFAREHVIYSRFAKFPKVDRYINTRRLIRLRNNILIDMDFSRKTIPHHEDVYVKYDVATYKDVMKRRWDIFKDEPLKDVAGLCYLLRKIVNSDESRQVALLEIYEKHPRMIVFYSFDYERDILLNMYYGEDVQIAEWSGHKHEPIPDSDKWVYLVNYMSGAEGWNTLKTNCIVFYSQTYSYKTVLQAAGRIDRLNTPYKDLYYYHLKTRSGIDLAISKALSQKKKFNEDKFVKW